MSKVLEPVYRIIGEDDTFFVKVGYRKRGWFGRVKTTWVTPLFLAPFSNPQDARGWCERHKKRYMAQEMEYFVVGA